MRRPQLLGLQRQLKIRAQPRKTARQREGLEPGAQVLADLAFDFRHALDQHIECTVLTQELGCGLGAHLVDAGNIVGAIPNERQIVDDLLRIDIKFGLHARTVERGIAHGIDERNGLVDELRHVLIAG